MPPKLPTAAIGVVTAAALALPASAIWPYTGLVSKLTGPAQFRPHGLHDSAKQIKQRFAGQKLFFVLGSREEGAGAVAAFRTGAAAKAYVRKTGRAPAKRTAHAAWNGYQTVFYSDPFLEGYSISTGSNSGLGDLSQLHELHAVVVQRELGQPSISSAKTGYSGAYLYGRPYYNTVDGYVYLPGSDSVEGAALLQRRRVVRRAQR